MQRLSAADPAALAACLTPAGLGLQALVAAFDSGESGCLQPLLCAMLPGVLRLQELSGPGLAQLAGEAKSAFVLYKYLPLAGPQVRPGIAWLRLLVCLLVPAS